MRGRELAADKRRWNGWLIGLGKNRTENAEDYGLCKEFTEGNEGNEGADPALSEDYAVTSRLRRYL